jgi:hypothetical protein
MKIKISAIIIAIMALLANNVFSQDIFNQNVPNQSQPDSVPFLIKMMTKYPPKTATPQKIKETVFELIAKAQENGYNFERPKNANGIDDDDKSVSMDIWYKVVGLRIVVSISKPDSTKNNYLVEIDVEEKTKNFDGFCQIIDRADEGTSIDFGFDKINQLSFTVFPSPEVFTLEIETENVYEGYLCHSKEVKDINEKYLAILRFIIDG